MADMTPSLTDRMVTIHATDITSQIPGKGTVTFTLECDLHVAADDMIVQAGSKTVALNAEGYGYTILPSYDPDAVTQDGVTDWWIVVRKSWHPSHPYRIRVPYGSGSIDLADIPAIRHLRGPERRYALTSSQIILKEGATWGATSSVANGVLTITLTTPPSAVAWDRGAVNTALDITSAEPGSYRIGSGSMATSCGMPVASAGILTLWGGAGGMRTAEYRTFAGEVWLNERDLNGWFGWHPSDQLAAESNAVLLQDWMRRRGGVKTIATGAVALRFDHGLANFNAMVRPLLEARNLPYSLALCSDKWSEAENSGVTPAMVNGWVQGGLCEAWNHSATHAGAANKEAATAEIVGALATLRSQLPAAQIDGFAVPGTGGTGFAGFATGAAVTEFSETYGGRLILDSHAVSSGYVTSTHDRVLDGNPRHGMGHWTLDTGGLEPTKSKIRTAEANLTGLQLMCHPSLIDTTGGMTLADLTALLDYIAAERDAGKLTVVGPYDLLLCDTSAARGGVGGTITIAKIEGLQAALDGLDWTKTQPANGTNLDALTEGTYPISTWTAAASMTPALPMLAPGTLEVFAMGARRLQRWTSLNPAQQWTRELDSATWTAWHRTDAGAIGAAIRLPDGTSADTIKTAGTYNTWSSVALATMTGFPSASAGILDVTSWGSAAVQTYTNAEGTWTRVFTGAWSGWRLNQTSVGKRFLHALSLSGQTSAVTPMATYHWRIPIRVSAEMKDPRIRLMNYDERENIAYTCASLTILGIYIGPAEMDANGDLTGNIIGTPVMLPASAFAMPDGATYWTGVLRGYTLSKGQPYMLSLAYTTDGTGQLYRGRGTIFGSAATVDVSKGTVTNKVYPTSFCPLNVRMEASGTALRALIVGDSHSVGSAALEPVYESPWSYWAVRSGVLLANNAEHGSATPHWQDASQLKWTQISDAGGADVLMYWLGQNDVYNATPPTLDALKTQTLKVISNARVMAGVKRVYVGTLMPKTEASIQAQEDLRLAYNAWVKTCPPGIDGVMDIDSAVSDPTTGEVRPEYMSTDNLHLNTAGCAAVGMAVPVVV